MKFYIQYIDVSPITNNFYEPCGDRAVVVLDGRNNLRTMIEDAHKFNGFRRPHYPHFKIMQGDFRNSKEVFSTIKEQV